MKKQHERHKNVNTFFTARNAAIMIVEYENGFEDGVDVLDEIRRIKRLSNINKIHIYLDFKLRCDNEYCYSEKSIKSFIENILRYCIWMLGTKDKKIIIHILQSQIVHNQIRHTTIENFITVAEMINDIQKKCDGYVQIQLENKAKQYALSKDTTLMLYYKPNGTNTTDIDSSDIPIELQIFQAKFDRGD